MNLMPKDVIYCIKVTPHDFYPTFPDNTLIAQVGGRPKWIEYDTNGFSPIRRIRPWCIS
jgi:hypothetical protein